MDYYSVARGKVQREKNTMNRKKTKKLCNLRIADNDLIVNTSSCENK